MPAGNRASTRGRGPLDVGGGVPLATFALVYHAVRTQQQIVGYVKGQGICFCPHAVGWRGADPYVLALVLPERAEARPDPLREWQWLCLADLGIPAVREGRWITAPRAQRPPAAAFLTHVYAEID